MGSEIDRLAATGTAGLDDILGGGLTAGRLYVVEGSPGTGKTTLGMGFLLQGAASGERCLYITMAETELELRSVAATHGWSLEGIEIAEISAADGMAGGEEQTLLHPSELELGETVQGIMRRVDALQPSRVVIDSLSELRLLAESPVRYRRQVTALKQFLGTQSCTVLVLDDKTGIGSDLQLHSIAHGVISLEQTIAAFGGQRRRLHVIKMRGMRYAGGYHDFEIERGGLKIFPRVAAGGVPAAFDDAAVSTGCPDFDTLLGGGLVPGTATLFIGPAGVGKTTTTVTCAAAALRRGEKAAYFLFDERPPTLLKRAHALNMDLRPFIESGAMNLRAINPAELSPGEFASLVRAGVERDGVRLVVIDSLNAYLSSMPNEHCLILQMHELLSFLGQYGVVTLLVLGMHGILNDSRVDIDLSYLADTAVQLRYFEAFGEVRQAVSVIKTRTSAHERSIREFQITVAGLVFGKPLTDFQGVLSGIPTFSGETHSLLPGAGTKKPVISDPAG